MGKNALKLYYPMRQAIESILPRVDEFVVALGDSVTWGAQIDRELGLVRERRRYVAVIQRVRHAVVVYIEQLRRQATAAIVPLAPLGIDPDPHLSCLPA